MIRLQKYGLVFGILLFHSLVFGAGLHAVGSDLYDANNTKVRLTGVNWFGLETSNMSPHGLWARDWKGMLMQVRQMGFNCIRFPWCNAMLRTGAKAISINFYGVDPFRNNVTTELNKELFGKSPLEIMDILVAGCQELGIAVILDCHSREPDGYDKEYVWYTATTSEQQWIDDWVFLATRYKNNPMVIGFDLDNEPHGKKSANGSQWGGDALYDWKSAAQRCGNAILTVNPNVLIIIEGTEQYDTTNYWWGGNLRGVHNNPVVLTDPSKLVYSPHEYGPELFAQKWFDDPSFPANMPTVWDSAFGFIKKENKAPLLIGEFALKDSASYSGKTIAWFRKLLSTLCQSVSWTYWCLNVNSGDTEGLLGYDWTTPTQWKLDMLKPYMAPFIGTPLSISTFAKKENPNNNILMMQNKVLFNGLDHLEHELVIMSLDGKELLKTKGVGKLSMSLKNTVHGVYVCVLRDNQKTVLGTRLLSVSQ